MAAARVIVAQRLAVIAAMIRSTEVAARILALAALDKMLESTHFSSGYSFEFGARSRDFGYRPRNRAEVTQWYNATFALIERLALIEGLLKPELRVLVARNFRGLWTSVHMHDELESLFRKFAADGFWSEGWAACRQTMRFAKDQVPPEATSRLFALEAALRPRNLQDRVRALVLSESTGGLDLENMEFEFDVANTAHRVGSIARELGAAVVTNDVVFAALLPELLRGGSQMWAFGRGLAGASPNVRATWKRLIEELERTASEQRDIRVLQGFLSELWERDRGIAQQFLDAAVDQPALVIYLPLLQSVVELDSHGIKRLKRALSGEQVTVRECRSLAYGRSTEHATGELLQELLLLIADQPDGVDVALEILSTRLDSDRCAQRKCDPALVETAQSLLRRVMLRNDNERRHYDLSVVVKACLTGPDAERVAAEIASVLIKAATAGGIYAFENGDLLTALFEVQPGAVLDALFDGDESKLKTSVRAFAFLGELHTNPADVVPCDTLIAWCETDRERRYVLAASIITFSHRPDESGSVTWSEHAKAILTRAPDPKAVLEVFIRRFQPRSWSGSRAAVIEANARLLDRLDSLVPSEVAPFVTKAKAQLSQEVARERQWETEHDRAMDERFEW